MDLAIRDSNAKETGWVFATYSYDGSRGGAGWWERMVPVGVMWGNDPDLNQATFDTGKRVTQGWINPDLRTPQHLGYLGRLNGPVDNPKSSCLSCHMTAEVPARTSILPPNPTPTEPDKPMPWFKNLPAGNSLDQRSIGTDYNLQISNGIQSFQAWKQAKDGFVAPPPQPSAGPSPLAMPAGAPGAAAAAEDDGQVLVIDGQRVYGVERQRRRHSNRSTVHTTTSRTRGLAAGHGVLAMDWVWYLFSFDGRINRAKYWLATLIVFCWMIFLAALMAGLFFLLGGSGPI